ncbi:hypothetical protein POX_f08175 [Penicillium oxalicum]|uniref:hypothetical protein n=1 Tax=Penicillium oxalicum TaxID=69781 RepID=UPI0020B68BD9|nr:hypothetical protein POX_f08175 [Penicillium oxalicum]KAI2787798.1 hypothetical protein POX_f08175 [Penicillium oxalicum]
MQILLAQDGFGGRCLVSTMARTAHITAEIPQLMQFNHVGFERRRFALGISLPIQVHGVHPNTDGGDVDSILFPDATARRHLHIRTLDSIQARFIGMNDLSCTPRLLVESPVHGLLKRSTSVVGDSLPNVCIETHDSPHGVGDSTLIHIPENNDSVVEPSTIPHLHASSHRHGCRHGQPPGHEHGDPDHLARSLNVSLQEEDATLTPLMIIIGILIHGALHPWLWSSILLQVADLMNEFAP